MNESIQLLIFQIWEVYKGRRCVRTYNGHKQAVKDIGFNNSGEKFLSCAYDRYCKLWDTETGLLMTFNPFAGDNILVYGIRFKHAKYIIMHVVPRKHLLKIFQ